MDSIIYLILICVLWFLYCSSIYIYYTKFTLKTTSYDNLMVVHHNCYTFNAKHIYLIRICFGKTRKTFYFLSSILLEFFDETDRPFFTLKIPPKALLESQKERNREETKRKAKFLLFLLKTEKPLTIAKKVRMTHDCKTGDLFVYEIRFVDLITKETYVSLIQSWIRHLPNGSHNRVQTFSITYSGRNLTEIRPSPRLIFPEWALFSVYGIHWILFHTQYLITSSQQLIAKTYSDTTTMALTGILSAFLAFVIDFFTIGFYFLIIKRTYSRLKGIGFIWCVRYGFLVFIICMSIVLGIIAGFKPEQEADNETDSISGWNPKTLKWFAVIVGIVIYTMIYLSASSLCHFWSFSDTTDNYNLRLEEDKSSKSDKDFQIPIIKTESNQSIRGRTVEESDSQPNVKESNKKTNKLTNSKQKQKGGEKDLKNNP